MAGQEKKLRSQEVEKVRKSEFAGRQRLCRINRRNDKNKIEDKKLRS
ncbi:MAG TPA: hypothetical protein PLR20_11300 [Syntrophales bacterium]|nr:hypothetical protein [Syntrophales bacterium]HOX93658.1 hypothetical protein [Syntrophales bacterium]HPI57380.1 hypothetical protein [Syntrophales bacterium]HPN25444.1 hypothetical protein [Syntrophales bacterium]HQM29926.1 hypothetical protein [Syntrophales bacterium]